VSSERNLAREVLTASVLQMAEPGSVIEWLYDHVGTGAVLTHLEALHRRDAQRQGEDLNHAGDHTYVAGALRAARVVSDDAATRIRAKGGR
jgi:hypothetical protein